MSVSAQIHYLLRHATEKLVPLTDAPRLEAEVLLAHVLGKPRTYLYAWSEQALSLEQAAHYSDLVARRQTGEPIAYLTGMREFWSREFLVTPEVLIPRPETELLVELALEQIPKTQACTIADLGVGSGAVAITLALERPQATLIASDISAPALGIAKTNAARLGATNLEFVLSDWLDGIPAQHFDIILSNPPYIAENDPHLSMGDLRFEPQSALVSGKDGLDSIRQIAKTTCQWLNPGGLLLLEHGYNQAAAIRHLLKDWGYINVVSHPDLAGHDRVTSARLGAV